MLLVHATIFCCNLVHLHFNYSMQKERKQNGSKIGRFTKHESKAKQAGKKGNFVEYRRHKLEIALKGDRGIFIFLQQEGYNIPDSIPKSIIFPQRLSLRLLTRRGFLSTKISKTELKSEHSPPPFEQRRNTLGQFSNPLVALQHPALLIRP